jgi:hypothetical protein
MIRADAGLNALTAQDRLRKKEMKKEKDGTAYSAG